MSTDPTLVLVHGAWHGTWCWSRFLPELARRSVATAVVELTTQGNDAAALGDLRSDGAAVRSTVAGIPGPVVLFAHSAYGGMVITEGAEGPDNIVGLIYLDAFMPEVGESMASLTGGGRAPFIHPENGLLTIVEGWGRKLFYHDCDPDVAADAEARLLPQAAVSFGQAATATPWRRIPSTYIVCAQDPAIAPQAQRAMATRAGTAREIDSGHSPYISQPGHLADLVREAL